MSILSAFIVGGLVIEKNLLGILDVIWGSDKITAWSFPKTEK